MTWREILKRITFGDILIVVSFFMTLAVVLVAVANELAYGSKVEACLLFFGACVVAFAGKTTITQIWRFK